jgi:hypothetical protein
MTRERSMSTTVAAASTQSDQFTGIPVQITNQLAVPVDIYDVFNPSPDGQTLPYQYTKLGTIAAGATGEGFTM